MTIAGSDVKFWANHDQELGTGAFGTVFKGVFNNEPCAVKILNQVAFRLMANLPTGSGNVCAQQRGIESFERECSCLKLISHPNVVKVFDIRTYNKFPAIVMELLDCSLTCYFDTPRDKDWGPLAELYISCDVASALDYLHRNSIIHRDLCGDNILLDDRRKPIPIAKVSDFGMSKILKDFERMSNTLTAIDGHRSVYYPPELQDDPTAYGPSIDIFMFGVVMLQIACKTPCIKSRRERKELIENLPGRHPMKISIRQCLEVERNKRPAAKEICTEMKKMYENFKQKQEAMNIIDQDNM